MSLKSIIKRLCEKVEILTGYEGGRTVVNPFHKIALLDDCSIPHAAYESESCGVAVHDLTVGHRASREPRQAGRERKIARPSLVARPVASLRTAWAADKFHKDR